MQTDERGNVKGVIDEQPPGNLPSLKPDDYQYFDKLLVDVDETTLSAEDQRERKIMKLLLKIKNGTPPMRKVSVLVFVLVLDVGYWSLLFGFSVFCIYHGVHRSSYPDILDIVLIFSKYLPSLDMLMLSKARTHLIVVMFVTLY